MFEFEELQKEVNNLHFLVSKHYDNPRKDHIYIGLLKRTFLDIFPYALLVRKCRGQSGERPKLGEKASVSVS